MTRVLQFAFAAFLFLMLNACGGDETAEGSGVGVHGTGSTWTTVYEELGDGGEVVYRERSTRSVAGRQTYRGRKVVVLEDTGVVEVGEGAGDRFMITYYIDPDTSNTVAHMGDDGSTFDFTPHDGVLSLPLEVGKTWTASYTETFLYREVTETTEQEKTYEVSSFEGVTTPAGTFMAYRVVQRDPVGSSFELFYDPDLALGVKTVVRSDGMAEAQSYLVSHDLG